MLDIKNLTITFLDSGGRSAVNGIDLHMDAGEILGLVGESGSGKTLTALAITGLLERSKTVRTGEILLDGVDLLKNSREEMRKLQGKELGVVFQEPMTALNPTMRVGKQVEEALRIHTGMSKEERKAAAISAMQDVELPDAERVYRKFPHELSGGQRQRVMLAAAMICQPKLLICDEPTTALDVTTQGQILKLLKKINAQKGIAILFISHDLSVVRRLCRKVAVMQKGRIVEYGDVEQVFTNPQDEYTKRLIAAIPRRGVK